MLQTVMLKKLKLNSSMKTYMDFSGGLDDKVSVCLECRRPGSDPWVRKILWRRKWQLTPVLLPGKIPWTVEYGRLQSMGSQRVRHD